MEPSEHGQTASGCQNQNQPKDPENMMKRVQADVGAETSQLSLKKFFCPCCNIGYLTSEEMINHIKQSPIKVKTYSCSVCLLEFFVRSDLIDHQRVDHQMMIHKKYKCDECDLDYSNMAQLVRHKQMHDEIAQKLAASGIFLPRPGTTDPKTKNDQSYKLDPASNSHSPQAASISLHGEQNNCGDQKNVCRKRDKAQMENSVDVNKISHETEKKVKVKGQKSKQKITPAVNKKSSVDCEPDEVSEDGGNLPDAAAITGDEEDDPPGTAVHRTQTQSLSAVRRSCRKKSDITYRLEKLTESDLEQEEKELGSYPKDHSCSNPKGRRKRRKRGRPRLIKNVRSPSGSHSEALKNREDLEEVEIPANLLNEDGSIRCPDCDVMCSSLNGLNRHRKFHFRTMEKLKCVFCQVEFCSRMQMGSHMAKAHPLRNCRKAYMLMPAAQQFSCTESGCTEVFSASISLTKHKTKVHGIDRLKVNICEDCGKRFPSRSALTVHRRMHTDERPFKCDLCPKAYRASSSLVLHRKSHGNKKPFVCEYCGVGFTCPNSLRRHVRCRHTGEKPYMCDGCGATFTDHSQLAYHAKTHGHGKLSSPGQYSCELCGKHFRTEHGIKSHKEKCVDGSPGSCGRWKPKPVMCEVCGRKFPAKLNLKNHMVTHTDERPHKCRFCDATFRHYKSKYSHEKVHKGHKDFICAVCGKAFYQRVNLHTHMNSHNSVKDFACCLCGKKFNSEHNRKRHEKRCRNYLKCPVCSAVFRVHHRLVRHLNLNHHGVEVPVGDCPAGPQPGPCPQKLPWSGNADLASRPKFADIDSGWRSAPQDYLTTENDRLSDEEQYVVSHYQCDESNLIPSNMNHYQNQRSQSLANSINNFQQVESPLTAGSVNHFQGGESRLMASSLSPPVGRGVDHGYPSSDESQFITSHVNHYQDVESRVIANTLSAAVVREVSRSHQTTYLY